MFDVFGMTDVIKIGDGSIFMSIKILLCRNGDYFFIVACG